MSKRVEIAPRIAVEPNVRFGKPVIAGTRVPVELVVGGLASGLTTEEVAGEYDITVEDVLAALAYATRVLAEDEIRATA